MNERRHKACYGTMFPETLGVAVNQPVGGKVFSFEIDRMGLGTADRQIDVNMVEWDRCRDCDEFDHCYKFCMAQLLLRTAIAHE